MVHVAGASPPRWDLGVTCCQIPASPGMPGCAGGIPGFTSLYSAASHKAATHITAGRSPSHGQWQLWKHEAASPHPVLGSDLPVLERDRPHAACQAPASLTSAIPAASGRGFLAFVFPLSQSLGRGKTLSTLSEMKRRRVRFRDSWQRITT